MNLELVIWSNSLNLRWAILFWIRLLSSGSVTSLQSSVLFLDEGLGAFSALLELEDECWCLAERPDILLLPLRVDDSLSVSEPEWYETEEVLLSLRLWREDLEEREDSLW